MGWGAFHYVPLKIEIELNMTDFMLFRSVTKASQQLTFLGDIVSLQNNQSVAERVMDVLPWKLVYGVYLARCRFVPIIYGTLSYKTYFL